MAHKNIAEALFAVQGELLDAPLVKDAQNSHLKNRYITLGKLLDIALPILRKAEVLLLQMPSHVDGEASLTTSFVHVPTGDSISSAVPLWSAKQDAQGQGGAITYLKRYSLMSALGLVADEDDDGASASYKQPSSSSSAGGSSSGSDDLGF